MTLGWRVTDTVPTRVLARLLNLQIPDVTWRPHRSGTSLLEHCDLLPRLQSVKDDAAAEPLHRCYAEQRHMRRRGNSYALWQMAEAGAVTLGPDPLPLLFEPARTQKARVGAYR